MSVMWEVVAGFFPFLYIDIHKEILQAVRDSFVLGLMFVHYFWISCTWGCWECCPKILTPEEEWNIVLWVFLELVLVKL